MKLFGGNKMPDMGLLKSMFKDTAQIAIQDHHCARKKVVLTEHDTKDSIIEIHNIPEDSLVINVDASLDIRNLINTTNGACKRADYLIISQEKKLVLFIEMKKGNPKTSDIIKQLKGSLCVFKYCQAIAEQFFDADNFLSEYKMRFVAFKNVNLTKNKTKIDKTNNVHDTPETLMKISWAKTIQFNKIAA